MKGVITAIIDDIIWSYFNIISKKIGSKINAKDALGIHLYFLPIGILGILSSYIINPAPLTNNYFLFSILIISFATVCIFENYLSFHIYKYLDTSSFFKIKLGIVVILSLMFDYIFFDITPTTISFLAATLFIMSGITLDKSKINSKLNLKLFFWIFINGLLLVINGFLMKKFTEYSLNNITNIYVLQTITQLFIGLYGYKNLSKIIDLPEIKWNKYIYVLIIFIGVITEFFIYKRLSLFMISALFNIRFIIYLGFDYYNGELKINKKIIYGIILGILGISILMLNNI